MRLRLRLWTRLSPSASRRRHRCPHRWRQLDAELQRDEQHDELQTAVAAPVAAARMARTWLLRWGLKNGGLLALPSPVRQTGGTRRARNASSERPNQALAASRGKEHTNERVCEIGKRKNQPLSRFRQICVQGRSERTAAKKVKQ